MERLASKPPLITPSASPPASHTFFPQPYRLPDQASPAKRPRLSSAPRQFQPHTSASSSTTSLDQIDFQKAREASALRMLDVWSNLADRYSRPLDEDDIIDLNTGKVVRDRGVIRRSRHWDLGCFADDVGEEEAEEGDEEEDDDDIDELDSFAPPRGIEGQDLSTEVDVRNVPPVREMDPADAEDLKQFLEAERRRRETCGSEVEETESSVAESHDERDYESERLRDSVHAERTDNSAREPSATSEAPTSSNTTTPSPEIIRTPVQRSAAVFVDSGSDDELVSYDIDEASIVYRLPKKEDEEDSDSEVEFVEPPLPPPRPKPRPKAAKQKPEPKSSRLSESIHPKPTQQLQTPPLSQTSSLISSVTPSDDYYIQLPPDSSSPLPPSSPPSSHYSSPIKPSRHVQNTNSSGSRVPSLLFGREVSSAPIPRLDLTKISKKKPTIKSKVSKGKLPPSHARRQPEASGSGSPPMVEPRGLLNTELPARSRQLSSEEAELSVKARLKMELVLDKRPPFQHNLQAHSSPTHHTETPSAKQGPRRTGSLEDAQPTGKGKRKEKQAMFDPFPDDQRASEDMARSDDAVIILSSSPLPASKKKMGLPSHTAKEPQDDPPTIAPRTRRQNDEKPISAKSQYGDRLNSASTTTTKKRKRVISSSEIELAGSGDAMSLSSDKQTQREADAPGETPLHTRTDAASSIGSESSTSVVVKDLEPKPKPKRKPTPKQRSRSSSRLRQSDYDSGSGSRSSPERFPEHGHRYNRAHSHFGSMPPSDPMYYPYPQPPYPPHLHHQPHIYAPIPDPRAQYIISQAMHQLSALVGGPWTPPGAHHRGSTPFTPSHNRHHSSASGSMYSTPTHHHHPYPYSYDPSLSRATLPLDSPEVHSSPAAGGSAVRHKSLVKRSRSRGRRVSFRIEEGIVDTIDIHPTPPSNRAGHDDDEENYSERLSDREDITEQDATRRNNKGKARTIEGDFEEVVRPNRGRAFTRAQTPGPPIRDPSSESRSDKPSTKPPVKARGTSRPRPSQAR